MPKRSRRTGRRKTGVGESEKSERYCGDGRFWQARRGRQRSPWRAMRGKTTFLISGCAWACKSRRSSLRAMCLASPTRTQPNSTTHDEKPVIYLMESQKDIHKKEARCGWVILRAASKKIQRVLSPTEQKMSWNATGIGLNSTTSIKKRLKKRYDHCGRKPRNWLMRDIGKQKSPWFVGVQSHPEFTSRPLARIRCSATSSKRRYSWRGASCLVVGNRPPSIILLSYPKRSPSLIIL